MADEKPTLSIREIMEDRSGKRIAPNGKTVNVVRETEELRRIRDMPRRIWEQRPNLEEMTDLFTQCFKQPRGQQRLRQVQATFFEEMIEDRGAVIFARVGAGKTLMGGLAPLACEFAELGVGKRPIYITRAGVRDDTRAALYEASIHWRIQPMPLYSYSKLALDYDGAIFEHLKPDLIILDESDAAGDTGSGTWHRLNEYIRKVRQEESYHGEKLIVVTMCGTPTDTTLNQYWHLVRAAKGEKAPMPRSMEEKNEWCMALDERVKPESRWQPGALVRLSEVDDDNITELKRARLAYGLRLIQTPGIIATGDSRPENKLHITATPIAAESRVAELISQMRETWCTPDGQPFETAMDLWRHCREAQCDFFNRWEPPPPSDWLMIRKAWWQARDDVRARYRLSTPGHVVKEIKSGRFDKKEPELVRLWNEWSAIKPTYKYSVVPEWIGDAMPRRCADWLANHSTGLLWTEFPALGERVAKETGIPFYRHKACDSAGKHIRNHPKGAPAIVSVKSCSYGLNLQYKFDCAAYATPMSTNKLWEQSLGRFHRDGQPNPIVKAETWLICDESYQSLLYAIGRAEMAQDTLQQSQKLCYADVRDFSAVERWASGQDPLWRHVEGASATEVLRNEFGLEGTEEGDEFDDDQPLSA